MSSFIDKLPCFVYKTKRYLPHAKRATLYKRPHFGFALHTAERFGIPNSDAIAYAESIKQIVREH